jgi:hypothetical protein
MPPQYYGNPFAPGAIFGAQSTYPTNLVMTPPAYLTNMDKREQFAIQLRNTKRKEIIESKRKKLISAMKYEDACKVYTATAASPGARCLRLETILPELVTRLAELGIVFAVFQDTQPGTNQGTFRLYVKEGERVGQTQFEIK